MKKIIFVLAICFIAVPAFAVDVSLVDNIESDGTISVVYTGADANATSTMPRAFALDITIDSPGTFTDVLGYKNDWAHDANAEDETGESNSLYPGYGIYPARITWLPSEAQKPRKVDSWGTPLALTTDPGGAGTGLNTGHLVLELGSLYYDNPESTEDSNTPRAEGTLCKIAVTCGEAPPEGLNIHMTDEDIYRGGLVFEDGSLGEIDANIAICGGSPPPEPATNGAPTVNVTTATGGLTTDLTWTAGAGATSHDVYFGDTYPPAGPFNQPGTTFETSTMIQGKTYYCSVVERNDAGTSAALDWSFNTDCMKSTGQGYTNWTTTNVVKKANCWCYQFQRVGDVDGKDQGSGPTLKRIGNVDLTAFALGYGKKRNALTTAALIATDIDHIDQGSGPTLKAVGSVDLAILASNYGKKTAALLLLPAYINTVPDYYFWTIAP
jgi:hypothetical protein